jgi:iron complex transport system ATP-binding protein
MGGLAVLEARDLTIGYGRTTVASRIQLEVMSGEVLCLLGPNGAGKTTLFKTLLGLMPPLHGRVLLEGQPLSSLARRGIARTVAYVPQAQNTEFAYSVFDLVLMGCTAKLGPFSLPTTEDRERTLAALESLGIAELGHVDSTRISGGERQLTLIARALAQNTRLIIMDEPTASLDLRNRQLVLSKIRGLAKRGFTVVLSTHEPDQVFALADKVAIVAKGTLFSQGAPDETMTAEILSDAYGLDVRVETASAGKHITVPLV